MIFKSVLPSLIPTFLSLYWEKLKASPLGYRLAKGAFWSLAGSGISRGLGLAASILVARMMGKANYGELGIIQSTVGMFGTFAGFGLGVTATKYVAELKVKDPLRAGRIIGLSSLVSWITGGAMSVALFILSPWLATHTLAAPHLSGLLRVGSLLLLLSAINGAQTGALAGFEAFKSIARINLISGFATFPLMVGGVWWAGVPGAVMALVLSLALNCLLNFFGLRAESARAGVPLSYLGVGKEWDVLWRFSLPAVGSGIFVGPIYWVGNTMMVNSPGGYAQMGIFNAANQWFGALLFLPTMLGQAALPVFAECLGQGDHAKSREVLRFYIRLNAIVVGPVVLFGCLASPWIMASYGPGFGEAWPTLAVVFGTAALVAIQNPVGQIITASGRMWIGTLMNAGWATCFIFLTWIFIQRGAFGFSSARLGAYLIHATWTFAYALFLLRRK